MASILIHTADESVTLTAQAVKRLLERGDGDAALLYLALLRHHGNVQPRSLAGELRWDRSRIEAAELALRELRLLAPAAEEVPEPADEKPSYQRDDIARRLLFGDGGPADEYLLLADYQAYCQAEKHMVETYADREKWNRMSLHNIARSGIFAADRAVAEYADNIWHVPHK